MKPRQGPKPSELNIDTIAARLEGLEETIILKLIDRAQFRVNRKVYRAGESGFAGEHRRSLFLLRLLFQEKMDSRFGRFCVPEERPFFSRLPRPGRRVLLPRTSLCIDDYNSVNLTREIVSRYLELIPRICRSGDDGHYGSSVEHDVYAVQAIARRVHYGSLFVAESKFMADPVAFSALIDGGDTEKIISKLTRKEIEVGIVRRIREKTRALQSKVNPEVRHRIAPDAVAEFYRDVIVPLTKRGEMMYLKNRRSAVYYQNRPV